MKIVHVNSSTGGGAANSVKRLHYAMMQHGIDSSMLFRDGIPSSEKKYYSVGRVEKEFLSKLRKKVLGRKTKSADPEYGFFSFASTGAAIERHPLIKAADIVYLHWICDGFISIKTIEKLLAAGKKIVWYMHDMWAITAGCHYSFQCTMYRDDCSGCMFFNDKRKQAIVKDALSKKLRAFSGNSNLTFLAPSRWLHNCVQESAVGKRHKLFHIPYAFDRTLYKPVDKAFSCKILGIDPRKKYLLFGAHHALHNPYKGWKYLQSALNMLKDLDGVELLTFGSEYNQAVEAAVPVPVRFFGRLEDDYSMVLLYNAADAFVLPSLADNLPNTMIESLSCGTPVVGFNVGGIPDLVTEKTGYLAEYKNAGDLANGIRKVIASSYTSVEDATRCCEGDLVIQQHMDMLGSINYK